MMYLGDRHVGLGVVEDITDRKRAEAAHRESRQALEAVIQSSAAAIIALDLQGNVTRWNPSAERLLGWTEAEVLGRPLPIVPPAEAEEFHAHRARWFQGGISTDAKVRPLRKDGSTVHVSLSVAPLRDATGQVVGAIGNLIDITERNRLQEQLRQAQRLDAIGSLAGGIAHDFNNLLTVIGARAHIAALRLPAGAPAGQELALITQTTEQAARLTRQLLAFSRKQVLEPRVLDLGQVVGEMHRMLRRLIGEHIELVTESDPALWPALADPSQIEQVIMNLAVNARDAMPDGGRLTIATRNVELDEAYARAHVDVAPGAFVMLAVTDTGHGMDPDVQARIFEPFFTTKAPGQGTGLGLATVYGIVKQSGGHIAVVSEIGVGSSFKVYLPRTTEATAPAEAAALDLAEPGGTETVLLVEDDAALRDLVRQTLTRSGYAVLEAPHPEEALRTLETYRGQIDLLFTDVVMPGMNGRVLADRARALRHGLKVLFMSGYPATAISGQPILDPATDFLPKPFMPPTLIRKVREALDSRS
jgi:PAS domain S-box-containing protein